MKELLREISRSPGRPTDDQGFGPLDPTRFFEQPVRFVEYIMLKVVCEQYTPPTAPVESMNVI